MHTSPVGYSARPPGPNTTVGCETLGDPMRCRGQAAALLTGVVLCSGALFAYHCAHGQLALAALHPNGETLCNPMLCRGQAAALLTGVVLSSGALFAYHCAQGQLALAALHPVALYSALLLLLVLPINVLFRVRARLWRARHPQAQALRRLQLSAPV